MNKRNIFEFVSILVTCILLLSTIYFLTFTLKQQDDLRAKMEMERVLFDIYAQSKVEAIDMAIERSKEKCAPTFIIMDTKKGAGIKDIEGDYHCHYMALDEATFEKYKKQLEDDYKARVARAEKEGE